MLPDGRTALRTLQRPRCAGRGEGGGPVRGDIMLGHDETPVTTASVPPEGPPGAVESGQGDGSAVATGSTIAADPASDPAASLAQTKKRGGGPKTEEGKKKSRRNALKTGF